MTDLIWSSVRGSRLVVLMARMTALSLNGPVRGITHDMTDIRGITKVSADTGSAF